MSKRKKKKSENENRFQCTHSSENDSHCQSKKCDCGKSFRNCLEVLCNWYATLTEQDFDNSWINKLAHVLQEELTVAKSKRANFAIVSFDGFEWRVSIDWFRHGAELKTAKIGVGIRPVTFLAAAQLDRHKRQTSKGGTL